MSRPLVSVITPTWQRPKLLLEAMENVRQQTYRPIEHVIISDGPDHGLRTQVTYTAQACREREFVPVRFVDLGRNWSSYLPNSFCAAPCMVGMLAARGEYQTWLADDERMDPDHIALLVKALKDDMADFAYSRVRMYRPDQTPEQGFDIGTPSPTLGQITNALWRADLLKRGLYPFGAGMTSDWACISQWINAGARWAYVDRVTMNHRIDH